MIDTNELREYARGFEDLREADLLNGAADEIDRLRAQLASRGGVPEGWPTDAMVIRGAETLHDALRAEGFDLDFDHDLRGTERQQSIAEAVFGAMLDAAPSPEGQAEQAEYLDEVLRDDPELFQPSNHTQGESFMSDHCYKCSKWPHSQDAKNQCKIALRTMAFDIDDPEYPREWRYVDGQPTCTAFVDREGFNARRRAARKPKLIPVAADDMFATGGNA